MPYKNCQSCGMPLNRDEKGGGTEKNGSKSSMYCSHCYQQGSFTLPDISVKEMQQRVNEKLKQMHIPFFLRPFFVRKIPSLQRWSSLSSK